MNTKIIIGGVGAVVVIVGGYFFISSSQQDGSNGEVIDNSSTTESTGKKMAFADFVKQGGSYKCTVHQYVNNTDTKGITYINGGMIKGEFNTVTQGMKIDTNFIVRDGYSYTWSSFAPTMGFKMRVDQSAEGDAGASAQGTYSFNATQIGDYDCQAWDADSSLFNIPSGVTFKEMN